MSTTTAAPAPLTVVSGIDPDAVPIRNTSGGTYYYPLPPAQGERLPSVTRVGGETEHKEGLIKWHMNHAAAYAAREREMLAGLSAEAAYELIREQTEAATTLRRDLGSYFHEVIEALLLDHGIPGMPEHLVGVTMPEMDGWEDYAGITSDDYLEVLSDGWLAFHTDYDPEVHNTEAVVYHLEQGYAGTLDCGMTMRRKGGRRLLLDWKSGSKTYQMVAEQLAAYREATEMYTGPGYIGMGEMVPAPQWDGAAVLHLNPKYQRGYVLRELTAGELAAGWNRFTLALQLYRERTALPSGPPGRIIVPDGEPGPYLMDLKATGYGHAPRVLAKAGVERMADLAAMTWPECLDVKGIGVKSLDTITRMLSDYGMKLVASDGEAVTRMLLDEEARAAATGVPLVVALDEGMPA